MQVLRTRTDIDALVIEDVIARYEKIYMRKEPQLIIFQITDIKDGIQYSDYLYSVQPYGPCITDQPYSTFQIYDDGTGEVFYNKNYSRAPWFPIHLNDETEIKRVYGVMGPNPCKEAVKCYKGVKSWKLNQNDINIHIVIPQL